MRDDLRLPGADAIGIGFDLCQSCRGLHDGKGACITGQCPAVGATADEGPLVVGDVADGAILEVVVIAVNELHALGLHACFAQVLQAVGVKALDVDGRIRGIELVLLQQRHHGIFKRVAARAAAVGDGLLVVPVRIFGLCIDRDGAACRLAFGCCDVDHILSADQRQLAIPFGGAVGAVIQCGAAQQRTQLMQGEVGDGPVAGVILPIDDQGLEHGLLVVRIDQVTEILRGAVLGRGGVLHVDQHARGGALTCGDIGIDLCDVRDIGAVAQPGVVARHQKTVTGHVHVQLDHVSTRINGFLIRHLGLLGVQARVAPVGDDLRLLSVQCQKLRLRLWFDG